MNSGRSKMNSGKPGNNSGRGKMNSGKSGSNSGRSKMNSGKPGNNSGRGKMNSGKPGSNSGKSKMNSGKPGNNSGRYKMNLGSLKPYNFGYLRDFRLYNSSITFAITELKKILMEFPYFDGPPPKGKGCPQNSSLRKYDSCLATKYRLIKK
jgi:hypothetical protein